VNAAVVHFLHVTNWVVYQHLDIVNYAENVAYLSIMVMITDTLLYSAARNC